MNSSDLASLLLRGGPLMVPLAVLSVLAVAIVLRKAWDLRDVLPRGNRPLGPVFAHMAAMDEATTRATVEAMPAPLRDFLLQAWATVDDHGGEDPAELHAELDAMRQLHVERKADWLPALAAIAEIAPLVGLLGTVVGMIEAFRSMESAGAAVTPALLASGIWASLVTTAAGLAIAIPSVAVLKVFERRLDAVDALMTEATVGLLGHRRRGGCPYMMREVAEPSRQHECSRPRHAA
jgi:biopolymer transport protein ExbB